MPVDTLDLAAALALVDLQKGITALPTAIDPDVVVERAARLADAAHAAGRLVVRVRTALSPDGGDVLRGRADAPGRSVAQGADFADLDPRVPSLPSTVVVTKARLGRVRQHGARPPAP